MAAPHPTELCQRTVELAREGAKPVAKLAKDLDISESCLRNWMAQVDADENGSQVPLAIPERRS
jgi:transposase